MGCGFSSRKSDDDDDENCEKNKNGKNGKNGGSGTDKSNKEHPASDSNGGSRGSSHHPSSSSSKYVDHGDSGDDGTNGELKTAFKTFHNRIANGGGVVQSQQDVSSSQTNFFRMLDEKIESGFHDLVDDDTCSSSASKLGSSTNTTSHSQVTNEPPGGPDPVTSTSEVATEDLKEARNTSVDSLRTVFSNSISIPNEADEVEVKNKVTKVDFDLEESWSGSPCQEEVKVDLRKRHSLSSAKSMSAGSSDHELNRSIRLANVLKDSEELQKRSS